MELNKEFFDTLFEQAKNNPRLRQHYDMRNSCDEGSQRMFNALLPGTEVAIHRHPMSAENVLLLIGRMDEVFYDADGKETARYHLDPQSGFHGITIPAGTWHSIEVIEPSVIFEAKEGRYGEDGSEILKNEITK